MSDAIWQLLYPARTSQVSTMSSGSPYASNYGVLDLTGLLIVEQGRGIPPLHYNVQRGTYQHGETPIGMRLDPRTIQIAIGGESRDRRSLYADLASLLRRLNPGRNWSASGALTYCLYRRIMPGGIRQWRSDLETVAGSKSVLSRTGRFAEWGLNPGDPFSIVSGADAGDYLVARVVNENVLELDTSLANSSVGLQYRVSTGHVTRDLRVLLEAGPTLEDDRQSDDVALNDTIRLVAHDPVWYNPVLQSMTWGVENLSNLIFYEDPNWTDRAVFPIWFGNDAMSSNMSLVYLGTWFSRPVVTITGPFTRVVLENISTGDKLNMVYSAVIGEIIYIDLDALTVTNNFGQNLMRYMSTPYAAADSDLVTFGLYPDPQVQDGVNIINLSVSGAVLSYTSVMMYWYSRYIGA